MGTDLNEEHWQWLFWARTKTFLDIRNWNVIWYVWCVHLVIYMSTLPNNKLRRGVIVWGVIVWAKKMKLKIDPKPPRQALTDAKITTVDEISAENISQKPQNAKN